VDHLPDVPARISTDLHDVLRQNRLADARAKLELLSVIGTQRFRSTGGHVLDDPGTTGTR
jgi:hypothetical protein